MPDQNDKSIEHALPFEEAAARTAFESGNTRIFHWRRGGGAFAEYVPTDEYVDPGIQSQWVLWKRAWQAALATSSAAKPPLQHLRFCLITANVSCNETRHPQQVMKDLGITYQHATPQSICDQWWFWNCEGVPSELPKYLTPLNVSPRDAIGYGLSGADADAIYERSAKPQQAVEDARDAERYRWLRSQHENGESACTFAVFAPDSAVESEATLYPVGCMPGELDAAIDAAIADDLDAWKCERCNGEGWHWEMAQVGERESDQQECKTDCRECGAVGFFGPDAEKASDAADYAAMRSAHLAARQEGKL